MMVSSRTGLNVAAAPAAGNICIIICAEEAKKKQIGAGPTTANAATTSTTMTLLPVPGPIVAVDSNSSAITVNRSPTTTTIVITTTLVVTTGMMNLLDVLDDPLLRHITSYVPNEDLMKVACLSKRMNRIIPRATTYESRAPGTIIPVLQMGPSKTNEGFYKGRGHFENLLHQLNRRDSKLQRYQHASIKDHHEFTLYWTSTLHWNGGRYATLVHQQKTIGPQLKGITSLDFCFSTTPPTTLSYRSEGILLLKTLPYLLPSLREVDLTHTWVNRKIVRGFFANCSRLEKMTFHINRKNDNLWNIFLNGKHMKTANHLRELYMDHSMFQTSDNEIDAMSDLDTTNEEVGSKNVFLFHKCSSTVLERVSMRNAMYFVPDNEPTIMPQKALMKFISNAPATLRWFRSTLTKDNIEILRHERPKIEFVS